MRSRFGSAAWASSLTVLAIYVLAESGGRMTHGFIAYYAAARLLLQGELGPAVYDDEWFMRVVQQMTGSDVLEVFGPNPPAVAIAALPVAWLDPSSARWVWLLLSLAAFGATTGWWLSSRATSPVPVPAPLILVLMLGPPVWANLRTGQIYLFVFAGMAAAAHALMRRDDRGAGLFLGLTLALKSAGAAWLTLVAAERRLRVVTTALLVIVVLIAGVMLLTGAAVWQRYPVYVQEFVQRPGASVTAYQTTWGFAHHLCVAHPTWNPAPIGECPALAAIAPPLVIAFAFIATAAAIARAPQTLAIAAGICLSVIAVPIAGDHHFVVLGLALLLLWQDGAADATRAFGPGVWVCLAVLYLLPMEWTAFRFTGGWLALAGYPRLYFVWLLWGLITHRLWRVRAQAVRK